MAAYFRSSEIGHDDERPSKRRAIFDPNRKIDQLSCIWLDKHLTCPPTQSLRDVILPSQWQFFSDQTQILDYMNSNLEASSKPTLLVASGALGQIILPTIHCLDQLEAAIIYCLDLNRNLQWAKGYPKVLNVVNEPKKLQFESVRFLVKYYKRLGERTDDSQLAQMYYMQAVDILRQYGDDEDVETEQLINEFETLYVSDQYRKFRYIEFEKVKRNKEDITVVWLDQKMNDRSEHVQKLLRKLNDKVQMYHNSYKCIQEITARDDKVFLIISGVMAELYLIDFHSFSQVDAIFIFCIQRHKYQPLFQDKSKYRKLVGCFTNEQDLVEAVHHMSRLKTYTNFSLLDARDALQPRLTKTSAMFLWNQLLLTVLCEMKIDEKTAKSELLALCRSYYSDNKTELHNIDCFEKSYDNIKAIVWYSKDSFVYKLLNKALRTHNHEILLAFQFYIKGLRQQLYESYDNMREKADEKLLTVYRGQMLHSSEFEYLTGNVGNFIAMNGFLSTSLNLDVALIYSGLGAAESSMPNYQSCLFVIEVDYVHSGTVFGDISDSSLYPDEKEVLFMAGSIFQISSIHYDTTRMLWTILLRSAAEAKDIVSKHLKLAKTELNQSNNILLFAKLMYYLGEFSKFDVYLKAVSNTLPEQQASIMHLLFDTALTLEQKGKTTDALNNYNQLLDRQLNNPSVASTFCSIAQLHCEQANYSLALSHFAKALEIQSKCFPIQHPVLMQTLKKITQIGHIIESARPIKSTKSNDNGDRQEDWDTLDDVYMKTEENSAECLSSALPDEDTVAMTPLLVYLVESEDESELKNQFSEKRFVYTNSKQCLEKINFTPNNIIFFVALTWLDESIISLLEQLPQIHSIYISTFATAENLQKSYSKVRFVCSDNQKNLIAIRLKKDLVKYYRMKGDQYSSENNNNLAQFHYKQALNYLRG